MEWLRHFLWIVEEGSFTAASRRAHLSQPALTASIRRLEEEMGARLLIRGRRGASPTAAGEALIPRARAALGAVLEGKRAIRELLELEVGEVRLAAGATACTHLLPGPLAAFRREHPGVRFLLRELTTAEALEALANHEVDLAIATLEEGECWAMDELILVAAPGRRPRPARAPLPFVSFRRGATSRSLLERHFPEAEIVMELGSVDAVKAHVRAGLGIALLSRHAAADELARGLLVERRDPRTPLARPLHLLHPPLEHLPPAASALREQLLADPPHLRSRRRRSGSGRR